jgi:DivIVA domain-containing protein
MALVVGILLIAAVLVAVALFAAGRIDGMSDAVPDSPPGLPDGPVTPEALREVRLPVSVRGYRMADVDELIERAAAELAAGTRPRPTPGASPITATSAVSEPGPRLSKPTPFAAPATPAVDQTTYTDVLDTDRTDG